MNLVASICLNGTVYDHRKWQWMSLNIFFIKSIEEELTLVILAKGQKQMLERNWNQKNLADGKTSKEFLLIGLLILYMSEFYFS